MTHHARFFFWGHFDNEFAGPNWPVGVPKNSEHFALEEWETPQQDGLLKDCLEIGHPKSSWLVIVFTIRN